MNAQRDRDVRFGEQDDALDSIERVIRDKMHVGHADETRYGFVARVANATPPVSGSFRQALRARILTERPGDKKRTMTVKNHVRAINLSRPFLVGALAALFVLILAFAVSPPMRILKSGLAVPPALRIASQDVDALVDKLNRDPSPRAVVVFPADYAEVLAGRTGHKVEPLLLDDDPTPTTIHAALGTILPSRGLVDVILVHQEASGVAYQVRAALEQRLYRLYRSGKAEIETFGALERNTFVVGPKDATLEPIGGIFEGGIELVAGGVLDDPQPGIPLRMAFDWRIQEPVSESLVMFVHLMRDDVELVAQRDAVPGNGLFPVEEWRPGELVRDQFALLLPPILSAGEYEIRVGIYDSTTLMRHSLIEPEGGTYVVVQQLDAR
jgi:hypothetical protein